ncbi:FHA domain-containing protein, partial [Jatrophihabitans endophyticus]|uniref:FHA domain-containing protein n=1 Tax=Jatrophihabitans endophyticus TaxID=1206085 RepID=UPI0019EA3CA4
MRFEFTVHVDGDEQDVLVSTPRPLRLGEVWPQLLDALGLPRRLTPELPLTAVLGERRFTTGSVLRSVAEDAEGAPATDVATGPCVQVIGGHDAGACAPLRSGPVRIGRDAHCELRLHDERVSRRHATIRGDANGAVVHDDVSTNGTTVEGAVVGRGEVPLPVGAVARVGDTVLTVREHDEPALPLVHAGGRLDVTPRP